MILQGDCLEAMAAMDEASVDAIVTDPPYGLEFMGKEWDRPGRMGKVSGVGDADGTPFRCNVGTPAWGASGNPTCLTCGGNKYRNGERKCRCDNPRFPNHMAVQMQAFQAWSEAWATEALRILKPGGHLLAFGGTRTYHRLACAVEDAGFEIRDSICWLYGAGFPKSHNLDRLRGEAFCGCGDGEGPPGEPPTEHDLSRLRGEDVSEAVSVEGGQGALLLSGVSESRSSGDGAVSEQGPSDGAEPRLEGRRDAQAPEGESQGREVRESARVGEANGADGRLRDGASPSNGGADRATPDANGSSPPPEPRSAGQPDREPGTLADERLAQDGRGWPDCERCGLPRVPRGLGTALKPAHEPIVVARKPLSGTVAQNVLEFGVGALNIDGTRIGNEGGGWNGLGDTHDEAEWRLNNPDGVQREGGRWPSNVTLSHLPECERVGTRRVKGNGGAYPARIEAGGYGGWTKGLERPERREIADADGLETIPSYNCAPGCPIAELDRQSGELSVTGRYITEPCQSATATKPYEGGFDPTFISKAKRDNRFAGERGGASRFFYCAKASRGERNAGLDGPTGAVHRYGAGIGEGKTPEAPSIERNVHPTVKPIDLMRWLVRLVTPPGGTVLDPFTGSGTTGVAAGLEGVNFIGCELDSEYAEIAKARIEWWSQFPPGTDIASALGFEVVDRVHRESGQMGLFAG